MVHMFKIDNKVVWGLFGVYTAFLLYMMLIGFQRSGFGAEPAYRYNLVPFDTIYRYVFYAKAFNTQTWAINLFGNIGVFIPYGFLLPVLLRNCRTLLRMLMAFYAGLFVAELLQLLLRVGSFDVDDFILNGLGALIGYLIYAVFRPERN
jgi:glycopeptide antibiotics resistance protein